MKLKAFTLMELLVGMVLMSIISVIAFSSYMLIQGQFFQLQKTQQTASEYQEIRMVLKRDFRQATWVEKIRNQLVLNREDGFVYYDIKETSLIRYHSNTPVIKDTFHFLTQRLICLNKGEQIQEGLLDNLVISLNVFEEAQRLSIKKEYSAEALINYSASEY